MLTIEQARKIFESSDNPQSGCCAKFVRIDNYYGIKMYEDEFTRDNTYKIQNIFAGRGIAPKAIQKIEFGGMYGYITETVVETLRDYMAATYLLIDADAIDNYDLKFVIEPTWKIQANCPLNIKMNARKSYGEFGEMVKAIADELGYIASDLHWKNIGYDKDGNLMLIDFDGFCLDSR